MPGHGDEGRQNLMDSGEYAGALPAPTPETQPFWDAALENRLCIPKCGDCGGWTYYPRPFCMHCFSTNVAWTDASGRGTLYSFAINYLPVKGFEDVGPPVIAVVQLDEGPRMIANLWSDGAPDPDRIPLDAPVRVAFRRVTPDIALPWFRLEEPA